MKSATPIHRAVFPAPPPLAPVADPDVVQRVLATVAANSATGLFPVTFAESLMRPAGHSMREHSHPEFQFELVVGVGHCTLARRPITVKGSLFLFIPPGVSHSFASANDSPTRHLTTKFRCNDAAIRSLPPVALEAPNRTFVIGTQDQMRRIVEEWQLHQRGYEHAVSLRVAVILLDALRLWQQPWSEDSPGGVLDDACRYMALHHGRPLSTGEVAAHCSLRTDSLCRLFRRNLRTTPGQYLLATRLRHAQALLRSGYSVTEAAARSGFSSIHYFSRIFRTRMRISPSEWVQRGAPADPISRDQKVSRRAPARP